MEDTTQNLTVETWLKSIFDNEVCRRAIDNTIKYKGFDFLQNFILAKSLKEVIPECFIFHLTLEGHDYWIEKINEM